MAALDADAKADDAKAAELAKSGAASHSGAVPAPHLVAADAPQAIHPDDVVAGTPAPAVAQGPAQGIGAPGDGVTPWRHVGGGGGGMVAATETPRVGPQVMGAFQNADESARAAAGNIQAADQDQAILNQAALLDERKRMEAEQQAIAAREKDRALELKARQEHADALAEEASHYGVDANRLWNSKSTGAKIGTILAMSLGAFGKNNDALEMFNTAKQQDIDEQKHNIALMGEHAATAKGLVGLAQSRFGDERQAEQAAHIAYIEAAKVRLQQMAAADKSVEASDNYARMMAGLDEQLAERKSQLLAYTPAHYAGGGGDQIDKKRLQNRIAELRDKSAAEGKPVSVDDAFRTAVAEQGFGDPLASRGGLPTYGKAEAKKGRGFDPENLTFNAPGGEGAYQARSPQSRESLMKAADKRENVDATLQDYERAVRGLSATDKLSIHTPYPTAASQAAMSAHSTAQGAIRALNDEGVWKAGEKPLLETQLPSPGNLGGHPDVAIHVFKNQAKKIWENKLHTEAAIPAQGGGQAPARATAPPSTFRAPGS